MKIIALLLLCPSLLLPDDIYLKAGNHLGNVQITDSTSETLSVTTKNGTDDITRSNILYYRFSPFDLRKPPWSEQYDSQQLMESIQEGSIAHENIRDPNGSVTHESRRPKEQNQEKLIVVKTVTGETIAGEFISASDSTVTYKTHYGLVTIEKKMILSADKPQDQIATESQGSPNDELTAEQKRVFVKHRLSIELQGAGVSSNSVYVRTSLYSSWRKWNAFEGFTPLTEEEFFAKTGYPKEAQQAHEYRNSITETTTFGAILAVGGAALLYVGYTNTTQETLPYSRTTIDVADPNTTEIALGYVASTVGSTLIIASAIGSDKNSAPYSTVDGMADEYNKKLVQRIKSGELTK